MIKIIGKTCQGDGIGTKIGFPTINFTFSRQKISGVFAAEGTIFNKKFFGAAFFGNRPTFNSNRFRAEIHFLNFPEFLKIAPGENIEVKIWQKIRDPKKFTSLEKLKEAIAEDCEKAGKIIKNLPL